MQITTRNRADAVIVAFEGNLDTNTADKAQKALGAEIDGGKTKLVVDFTKLDYISSAGLRVLLSTAKRLRGSGGALRLFGLNEAVTEVFEISGFSTIFNVSASESTALGEL
ncbi:MAG: STAS domain-containing protein [Planctomycetota bacterium]|jgi:anti-anti-sigma factor